MKDFLIRMKRVSKKRDIKINKNNWTLIHSDSVHSNYENYRFHVYGFYSLCQFNTIFGKSLLLVCLAAYFVCIDFIWICPHRILLLLLCLVFITGESSICGIKFTSSAFVQCAAHLLRCFLLLCFRLEMLNVFFASNSLRLSFGLKIYYMCAFIQFPTKYLHFGTFQFLNKTMIFFFASIERNFKVYWK